MYILGISAFYHDSAACLLANGQIIAAAQEERFTRIKNDNVFPANAIRYCLREAGITLNDVGHIVFYEKPFLKFERILETHVLSSPNGWRSFLKSMPVWLKDKLFQKRTILRELEVINEGRKIDGEKLHFASHHQSHAASAFYPSPFKKALVLSLDGVGEWVTSSVWLGDGNKLTPVNELHFPHSLGLLYSAFTQYLGFKVNNDEYKVMGLAPYGKPIYAELILKDIITLNDDGSFYLNMRYFNYTTGLTMVNKAFCELFKHPVRKAETKIELFHMDIAASIQQVTERVVVAIVKHFSARYNIERLCLAGGVALNCVANGKILQRTGIKQLWVQPAAGDGGGALGAAYCLYHQHLNHERVVAGDKDHMRSALLGPSFTTQEVEAVLKEKSIKYIKYDDDVFYTEVSKHIEAGKAIGWFMGRMEFGPRALGARSIIADPRLPGMQHRLNLKVKFRESFRPFAPAILEDKAQEYYELQQSSPYMLVVADLKPEHRIQPTEQVEGFDKQQQHISSLPAVTHVDHSSRIQTVGPENVAFYRLLTTFYERTGCPAIVNTSFNVRDQPIVCTPQEALNCFFNTDIDVLAIEGLLINKLDQ